MYIYIYVYVYMYVSHHSPYGNMVLSETMAPLKVQWLKAHLSRMNIDTFFFSLNPPSFQAYRSKQIFDIWTDVWSGQRSRLKYVISTQAAPGQHRCQRVELPSWKSSKGGLAIKWPRIFHWKKWGNFFWDIVVCLKCCVAHCTQWFCWSLSLWKMASYHWEY